MFVAKCFISLNLVVVTVQTITPGPGLNFMPLKLIQIIVSSRVAKKSELHKVNSVIGSNIAGWVK